MPCSNFPLTWTVRASMVKRPFFADPDQHADGPPRRFGIEGHPHRQPTPQERREQYTHPAGVLPALQSLLYLLVVALFLMAFTAQPIRIPSASMEPTLLVGDFLLLDKQAVSPDSVDLFPPVSVQHGDIIVFHDPVADPAVHLVKRVVAVPGDRLHLRDGIVYLNGIAQSEPYTIHRAALADPFRDDFPTLQSRDADVDPSWWIALRSLVRDGELTVPPGQYFVMGDNRNNSEDSRYWGFVPREAIVGKPLLIYFSWKEPVVSDPERRNPAGASPGTSRQAPPFRESSGSADFARWDRTFQVVR